MNYKTKLRLSPDFAAMVLLAAACALPGAPKIHAGEPEKIEVTVTASIADELADTGKYTFSRDKIMREAAGDSDLNSLTRTLPNVQFDNSASLTTNGVLDIRPENISISGGRFYENNFVINGLSSNSMLSIANQDNMHDAQDIAGHSQSLFVNPALVESMSVYETDVPARFGGFTGGVVDVALRKPKGKFGGEFGVLYGGDSLTHYVIPDNALPGSLPPKPDFGDWNMNAMIDLPAMGKFTALLAWSRQDKTLNNTKRQIQYDGGPTRSESVASNYMISANYHFSPCADLSFSSIYEPAEQMNHEQSVRTQNNNGWNNNLEFLYKGERHEFKAAAGYQKSDKDRHHDAGIYIYKNFAGYPVLWGNSTTSIKGGYGDLVAEQEDIPLALEYKFDITRTLKFEAGAVYTNTKARSARPVSTNQYTNTATAADTTAVSALEGGDPTVIEGYQGLNRRAEYRAYDITVDLNTAGAWAQLMQAGKARSLEWAWRAGLRYDYDDFLKNSTLSPRVTGMVKPFSWLSVSAGYNRYYTHAMLAYKLNEARPNTYNYTRTAKNENGKHVYYNDDSAKGWIAAAQTVPFMRRMGNDIDTPYADEYSGRLTFGLRAAGDLSVAGLIRRSRDSFARASASETDIRPDGTQWKYYRLTNNGWTDYKSVALVWTKQLANHRFNANATFSRTEQSQNDTYDELEEDVTWWNQQVYYQGRIQTRREAVKAAKNYSKPTVVNVTWSSQWLKRRVLVDIIGKWTASYKVAASNGNYTDATGTYPRYTDYTVNDMLKIDINLAVALWDNPRYGRLQLEARAVNIFDGIAYETDLAPTTSASYYQTGRTVRIGMRYIF